MKASSRSKARSEGSVTVHDIAAKLGVSAMTVSRALSGNGTVAKETRAKVLAAAEAMAYVPNLSAKVLKNARTQVLGMLVSETRSPHIAQVISAVSQCAVRAGQDLVIFLVADEPGVESPRVLKLLGSGICDGLIVAVPKATKNTLDAIARGNIPAVLINYGKGGVQLPVVKGDNYDGARQAVQHLLDLGHRRVAFVAGSTFSGQSPERQRGYSDCLIEAGLEIDPTLIVQGEFHPAQGYEQTLALLSLAKPPTAIFAANDEMAIGVLDAVRVRGLKIPEDVSVVGFDDIPAASFVPPGLTTVRQPLEDIAQTAVSSVLNQLDTRAKDVRRVEFPSRLIVRGSTAPPAVARDLSGRNRKKN